MAYLIKNGDLYKIGITKNYKNRIRQLKPDSIVAKLYSKDYKNLEKEFHQRYRNVRIPQTEYFRLDHRQIRDIKKRIIEYSYPISITYEILLKAIFLLIILFLIVFFFISLLIKDIKNIVYSSFYLMDVISISLAFLSLFTNSTKHFSFLNESKYRLSRLCVYVIFSFGFRFASKFFL